MDLDTFCAEVPFALPVDYNGSSSAPVAAMAQILGHTEMYDGDPLQACIATFQTLQGDYKEWKPSQDSTIPHISPIVHFARRLRTDWFKIPDKGMYRIAVCFWLGEQVRVLNECTKKPRPEDEKAAIDLLTAWADLARESGPGLIRRW